MVRMLVCRGNIALRSVKGVNPRKVGQFSVFNVIKELFERLQTKKVFQFSHISEGQCCGSISPINSEVLLDTVQLIVKSVLRISINGQVFVIEGRTIGSSGMSKKSVGFSRAFLKKIMI